jgi:hypothetical protein
VEAIETEAPLAPFPWYYICRMTGRGDGVAGRPHPALLSPVLGGRKCLALFTGTDRARQYVRDTNMEGARIGTVASAEEACGIFSGLDLSSVTHVGFDLDDRTRRAQIRSSAGLVRELRGLR